MSRQSAATPSATFSSARKQRLIPLSAMATTMESTPRTGLMLPSRPSSPKKPVSFKEEGSKIP